MTVPSEVARQDYIGNGVTTVFPYTFRLIDASHMRVILRGTDGVEVEQTIDVDFTLSGVGSPSGGSVTMTTAPANAVAVALLRQVPGTQLTDLRNQSAYYPETIEDAFDISAMRHLQQQDAIERSLRLPESEAGSELLTVLPPLAERKGRNLSFDATTGQPAASNPSSAAVSAAMEPVVGSATLELARAAMGPWGDALVTSAGSSTARDLQTRFSEIADVLDFGADRTGVADSATAIQNAINSGAKCVYLPGGTYKIGAAGLTGVSNQVWVGDGRERTIIKMGVAPTYDMVYFTGCADFGFEELTFDGNDLLTGGSSHFSPQYLPCVYILGSHDFFVRRCGFKGFYTAGIIANVCYRAVIEQCVCDRGSAATFINTGIATSGDVGAESYHITIRNNFCNFCQISTNMHDSVITENIVTGWGFSAGINTQAHQISYNLVISNNICFNSNQANDASPYSPAGIENWATHSTITGNICYGNFGEGIDNGGANCTITGNVCYNNKGYGLYNLYQDATYNASNSLVTGNLFYDTRAGGSRTQIAGYAEQAGGLVGICFQGNVCRNNLGGNVYNTSSRQSAAQYDWIAPTLLNSWVNFGGGTGADAGYYKDSDGIVHLRGMIRSGTIPASAFNLPSGFRPTAPIYFPIASNNAFGLVIVNAGGDVTIQVGSSTYADIGGISFRAA